MAGTGPASGGVRGEALPSEALQAPLGRTASLGPTAFFQRERSAAAVAADGVCSVFWALVLVV